MAERIAAPEWTGLHVAAARVRNEGALLVGALRAGLRAVLASTAEVPAPSGVQPGLASPSRIAATEWTSLRVAHGLNEQTLAIEALVAERHAALAGIARSAAQRFREPRLARAGRVAASEGTRPRIARHARVRNGDALPVRALLVQQRAVLAAVAGAAALRVGSAHLAHAERIAATGRTGGWVARRSAARSARRSVRAREARLAEEAASALPSVPAARRRRVARQAQPPRAAARAIRRSALRRRDALPARAAETRVRALLARPAAGST